MQLHRFPPTALLLSALLLLAVPTRAVDVILIDQQNVNLPFTWAGGPRLHDVWGQRFKAGVSGQLIAVELAAERHTASPDNLDVSILNASRSTILAKVLTPPRQLPRGTNLLVVDLSAANLQVSAGEDYYIDVRTDGNSYHFLLLGCPDNFCTLDAYTRGYAHQGNQKRQEDVIFRTHVKAIGSSIGAPKIVAQPFDLNALRGEPAAFRALATGDLPTTIQWYHDGSPVPGGTGWTLNIPAASVSDEGEYWVEVRNAAGVAVSKRARLATFQGPEVISQTTHGFSPPGDTVTLFVDALAKGIVTYQWYKDDAPLPGKNDRGFSFVAQIADSGRYWVRLTDDNGAGDSAPIDVLVRDDSAREKWRAPVNAGQTPVVDSLGSSYYIGLDGLAVGVRPDGGIKWRSAIPTGGGQSPPVLLQSGRILSAAGGIKSFHPDLGTLGLDVPNDSPIRVPTTYDPEQDKAWLLDADGDLTCMNATTGAVLWQKRYFTDSWNVEPVMHRGVGRLYVPGPRGRFLALSADNGSILWERTINAFGPLALDTSGIVYVRDQTALLALDGANGATKWRYELARNVWAPIIVARENLFFPDSHEIVCLDLAGQLKWRSSISPYLHASSAALAQDGTLYVSFGQFVVALDSATGLRQWDYLGRWGGGLTIGVDGSILFMTGSYGLSDPYIVALQGSSPLANTSWPKNRGNLANNGSLRVQIDRALTVPKLGSYRESARFTVPILLKSFGDVGGMTFTFPYQDAYMNEPEWTWLGAAAQATAQVNTSTPGLIRAAFALGNGTIPAGEVPIAQVSFRARSVPRSFYVALAATPLEVYRSVGLPVFGATDSIAGRVRLVIRDFPGDNNGNVRLDVADASAILRLLTLLDPTRPWDIPGNDLNFNNLVDTGDAIRVLRVVAGLDPQPPGAAAPLTAFSAASGRMDAPSVPAGASPAGTAASGALTLEADPATAAPGQTIRVRVKISGRTEPLAGASFTLGYPAEALRLAGPESIRTGSLVPTGAAQVWNLSPAQTDFAQQDGHLTLALSSGEPWPSDNSGNGVHHGVLAEFTFTTTAAFATRSTWPITLRSIDLSAGLDLERHPDGTLLLGAPAPAVPILSARRTETGLHLALAGHPGARYRLETSPDLQTWSLIATLTTPLNTTDPLPIELPLLETPSPRFYRALPLTP